MGNGIYASQTSELKLTLERLRILHHDVREPSRGLWVIPCIQQDLSGMIFRRLGPDALTMPNFLLVWKLSFSLQAQRQHQGVVCDLFCAVVRNMTHGNAQPVSCFQVHIVEPHTIPNNHPCARELIEEFCLHSWRMRHYNGVTLL